MPITQDAKDGMLRTLAAAASGIDRHIATVVAYVDAEGEVIFHRCGGFVAQLGAVEAVKAAMLQAMTTEKPDED